MNENLNPLVTEAPDPAVDWEPSQGDWAELDESHHGSAATAYQAVRDRCPVAHVRMPNGSTGWAVLGADELRRVLLEHETFSSATPHFGDVPVPPIEIDPPNHTKYRRRLNAYFAPQRIDDMVGDLTDSITDVVDPLVASGGGEIAGPVRSIPVRALCKVLGVPDEQWRILDEAVAAFKEVASAASFHDRELSADRMEAAGAGMGLAATLIAERRAEPRDDIISGIISHEIDGEPVKDEAALAQVLLLLLAGFETTWVSLCVATYLLARDETLQARLRNHPDQIPAAVEEMLRFQAPVQTLDRVATRDVELGGRTIRGGDVVLTMFGAANVDPAAFPEPALVNLDRGPNRHFSFGHGVHKCVGAPLARAELAIYVRELLSRTSQLSLRTVTREPWPLLGFAELNIAATAAP